MTAEVRNCPRCGSDEIAHGYSAPPMQGSVCCYAEGCEAITIAGTEAEAIARWNSGAWDYRPISWDDFGTPDEFEHNGGQDG